MSDLIDLGYLSVICLGIATIFHLKGTSYYTVSGRAAAARNILLAIVLGIYLFKHAIAVLGVAFFLLGYTAITSEITSSTSEAESKPVTRVRGIANKAVTRKPTVKKSPLRKISIRRTPVRGVSQGSFQLATRFSVPPTIFNASPRRHPVFTQKERDDSEAFKKEIEAKYGPLIEGPIPRKFRSWSGSE